MFFHFYLHPQHDCFSSWPHHLLLEILRSFLPCFLACLFLSLYLIICTAFRMSFPNNIPDRPTLMLKNPIASHCLSRNPNPVCPWHSPGRTLPLKMLIQYEFGELRPSPWEFWWSLSMDQCSRATSQKKKAKYTNPLQTCPCPFSLHSHTPTPI